MDNRIIITEARYHKTKEEMFVLNERIPSDTLEVYNQLNQTRDSLDHKKKNDKARFE